MSDEGEDRQVELERGRGAISASSARVLRVDARGRVVDRAQDDPPDGARAESLTLADLLPGQAAAGIVDAIRAARDSGRPQFLEFDLLSPDGVRHIHAETSADPDHDGEFVVISREVPGEEPPEVAAAEAEIASAATVNPGPAAVFSRLASEVARLVDYDRLTVVTVHTDSDSQRVLFCTDPDHTPEEPLPGSAVEVAARTGAALVVAMAVPSLIVVPLRWADEVIAFLTLHSKPWEVYGESDLKIVERLVPPLAASIAFQRARAGLDRAAAERAAHQAVAAVAAAAGDHVTMLEVAADRLYRIGRYVRVEVEGAADGRRTVARRGPDEPAPDLEEKRLVWMIGPGTGPVGRVSVSMRDAALPDQSDRLLLSEIAQCLAAGIERLESGIRTADLAADLECVREIEHALAVPAGLNSLLESAAKAIERVTGCDGLAISVDVPRFMGAASPAFNIVRGAAGDPGPPNSDDGESSWVRTTLEGRDGTVGTIAGHWPVDSPAFAAGVRRLEIAASRLAERVESLAMAAASATVENDEACLAEVRAALDRTPEPGPAVPALQALKGAVSVLQSRFEGCRVSVSIIDPLRGTITDMAVSGPSVPGWAVSVERPCAGSIEARAVAAGTLTASAGESPDALVAGWRAEAPAVGAGMRAFAAMALSIGGDNEACLAVRGFDGRNITMEDVSLLRRVAGPLTGPAAALAHSAERDRERAWWDGLARIGRIGESARRSGVPYERFSAELASLLPYDHIEIVLLDTTKDEGRRVHMTGRDVPGWTSPCTFALAGTATGAVVRSRAGLIVDGSEESELGERFPAQAAALAAGLRALAAAPMIIEDEPAGCIVLRSTRPFAFSPRHLAVLESAASHLAAIEANVRLRQSLERRERERIAVASIGIAASWGFDPEAAARRAADAFSRVVGCDGFVVTAVGPEGDGERVVFSDGMDDAEQRFNAPPVYRLGGANRRVEKSPIPGALRACIGPSTRPLGHIQASAAREAAFTEADAELLQRIADQLGVVFERTRAGDHSARLSEERELRRRLDRQNQELKHLTASRDRFLRTVVHELRNPLTSIQAFTDLLLENPAANLSEDQIAQLSQIDGNGERLKGLIEDLLDMSSIESETFVLERAEFDAGPMFREMCESFGGQLASRDQRIELNRPPGPIWLCADRARLGNVMSNLISNACKYSPDGTTVRVDVARNGRRLHIAVADEGIGISGEAREKLFDPFVRGTDRTVLEQPGTGLGLMIARSIVRLHGGDLTLEPRAGGGTIARFDVEGATDGPSEGYLARAAARAARAGDRS